jgi:sugar/nucleoside kinase (ribokinase family)
MSIWVCGEVLIDILPTGPVVGGGPANTAKALARLGHDVDFIDGISSDAYGVSARKELERDGVGLSLALSSDKPTCTATVTLDSAGSASYEFLIDGTATFDFSTSWLPDPERLKPSVLHIGTWSRLWNQHQLFCLTGRLNAPNLHLLSLIPMCAHQLWAIAISTSQLLKNGLEYQVL